MLPLQPPLPQNTDCAAAVLMMNRAEAERRGLPVLATLRSFVPVAVEPGTMGTAPLVAVSWASSFNLINAPCNVGGCGAWHHGHRAPGGGEPYCKRLQLQGRSGL